MKGFLLPVALLCASFAIVNQTAAQVTAFSYQGRLTDGGAPANGTFDLRFTLYDVPGGTNVIGGPLTNAATAVSSGLFSAMLDFGSGAFNGGDRWLEVAVRASGGGQFVALTPRQRITASPYAVFAGGIANGGGALTNLNASALASGTVATARLGSGSATSSTFLAGDQSYKSITTSDVGGLDTNTFVRTLDPRTLVLSNANSQLTLSNLFATNLFLQSEAPNSGSIMWTNGGLYLNWPSVLNSWFVNKAHGGVGDGSEWQFSANLIYMGPVDGGHMQLGLGSQRSIVTYMQFATPPSGDIHKGHSHVFGWRAGYDVPPSYSTFNITQWNTKATNYDNVYGHGKLMLYSPLLPTQTTDISLGTNIANWDSHGWTEAQSYRSFNYEPTWTGTNLTVSMLKDVQNFVLTTNANVTLTDVLLTNLVWKGDLFFYSPFQSVPIGFPATWNWESESGLAVAPTNVTGSNFLHVHVTYSVGTATNIIANHKSGSYTPAVDADAVSFFTAASITDATQKAAVNRLVLDLKAAGLWARVYALYPFVGGTSNTCSWNLKDTTKYRIGWPTPPTFDANGITGDGSSQHGDTHFKPSVDGALTNCGIHVYVRTALPIDGSYFLAGASTSGGRTWHGMARSGANLVGTGLNILSGGSIALASSDLRGNNMFVRGSDTAQIIAHNANRSSGDATTATVNCAQNLILLARGNEGATPDNFTDANLAGASITQYMTDSEISAFFSCWTNFESMLGRQVP